MKNLLIISSIAVMMAASASAQQLPLYNQYHINPFLYNPSQAGIKEGINANLIHKSQWMDIPGAPETSLLSVDAPVNQKNIGLGFTLYNDVTDITQRTGAYSAYSYKLKVNDEHTVYAGLSLGVLSSRIDFTKAIVRDLNDPFLLSAMERRTTFDATLGATYQWKELEAGLAVPHLLGQKNRFMQNESVAFYQYTQHLLASVKYTFAVVEEKGMTAYPLVMVRAAKGVPIQYDINAVFDWENIGWAAVTYRSNYAIGLNLGVRINDVLRAGYAYDLSISPVGGYTGGAHEILLGFTFGRNNSSDISEPVMPEVSETPLDERTDSVLLVLKNNDLEQKAEIEILKEEIAKLKDREEIKPAEETQVLETENENVEEAGIPDTTMKKAPVGDFVDSNGNTVAPGHYVVMGSFVNKENAENARKLYLGKGYNETGMMYNEKRNFTYVYVIRLSNREEADIVVNELQELVSDSWVLLLE